MGIFHVRVANSPADFYLLSPVGTAGLSDYRCADEELHWFFCSNCGVRCFVFASESELAGVDLDAEMGNESEGEKKKTKVWKRKAEGWREGRGSYLRVNALTIEAGQEGFDLREAVDKKWVAYLDRLNYKEDDSWDYPQVGGTW